MRRISIVLAIATLAVLVIASVSAAGPVTGPLKWSQPPYEIAKDPAGIPIYWGWDQLSWGFAPPPNQLWQAADDWRCRDNLPVTDIHWWGSYIDWRDPIPPPSKPAAFWIGIYTDIPVQPGIDFSRPGQLIWSYVATTYREEFVGYDVRYPTGPIIDSTFQYNVLIPQSEWFYQPGQDTILWLSIVAIQPTGGQEWGWKTRPHYFQDDAVWSQGPTAGWQPLYGPDNNSWDLAFELSTIPEPGSLVALGTGLVGLVGFALRKRR